MPRSRKLSLFAVTALGINTIVGSGIFRLPSELARELGPASSLVFLLCALLLVGVALSFVEAGAKTERSGGAYVYVREAYGNAPGFLIGWSTWIGAVLTLATAAVAIPGQLAEIWPSAQSGSMVRALPVAIIAALGAINIFGVRRAGWLSSMLVIAKMLPLAVLALAGLFFVDRGRFVPFAPHGSTHLGSSLLVSFFALSGFETSALPAAESDNPKRAVPLGMVLSLAAAALLYTLIQFALVGLVPNLGQSERPIADAARVILGDGGAAAVAVLGSMSMLGLCAAMALAGPRSLVALAEDDLVPPSLGGYSPRFATPVPAIVATVVLASVLALALDFRRLVDFTSVTVLLQYAGTCLAAPVLHARFRDLRILSRLGVWISGVLGFVVSMAIMAQVTWMEGALAGAVMMFGVILCCGHRMRTKSGHSI